MKKCCIIIQYFGVLPNYFQLFLNSCATNKNYDWLLLTDDTTPFVYPSNVRRAITQFDDLVQLFSQKLDMQVALPNPYKLCDYRPAYGFLFSEHLTGYKYWGHCDIDTIMGDLDAFITDEIYDKYDKIFTLGHLTLYRNTPEVNRAFMTDGHYQRIFSTNDPQIFDERPIRDYKITIDQLFEKNQLTVFKESYVMDVYHLETLFRRVKYDHVIDDFVLEKRKKALYVWQEGKIKRYFINNDKELVSEEFIYIHLQKRKMKMLAEPSLMAKSFKIVPNAFMELRYEPTNIRHFKQEKKINIDRQLIKANLLWLYNHVKGSRGRTIRKIIFRC